MGKLGVTLLCFFWLSWTASAVPVIGVFTGQGGLTTFLSASGGVATTGRVTGLNPASNIASVEAALGIAPSGLSGLPGATYTHASAIASILTGAQAGDEIIFTASSLPATGVVVGSPGGPPIFNYFFSLDLLTGPTATIVTPLALTTTAQQFSVILPEAGNYLFGLGAVRTNPGNSGLGHRLSAYGTSGVFSGVQGVPEIDAGAATLPLALLFGTILLATDVRRRRVLS